MHEILCLFVGDFHVGLSHARKTNHGDYLQKQSALEKQVFLQNDVRLFFLCLNTELGGITVGLT